MDYDKLKVWGLFIVAILLVVSIFTSVSNKTSEEFSLETGWRYEWVCSRESAYSQEDYNKGYYCLLEPCESAERDGHQIKNCICKGNNKTVSKICTDKMLTKHLDWETFTIPENETRYAEVEQ